MRRSRFKLNCIMVTLALVWVAMIPFRRIHALRMLAQIHRGVIRRKSLLAALVWAWWAWVVGGMN